MTLNRTNVLSLNLSQVFILEVLNLEELFRCRQLFIRPASNFVTSGLFCFTNKVCYQDINQVLLCFRSN